MIDVADQSVNQRVNQDRRRAPATPTLVRSTHRRYVKMLLESYLYMYYAQYA